MEWWVTNVSNCLDTLGWVLAGKRFCLTTQLFYGRGGSSWLWDRNDWWDLDCLLCWSAGMGRTFVWRVRVHLQVTECPPVKLAKGVVVNLNVIRVDACVIRSGDSENSAFVQLWHLWSFVLSLKRGGFTLWRHKRKKLLCRNLKFWTPFFGHACMCVTGDCACACLHASLFGWTRESLTALWLMLTLEKKRWY